MGKRTKYDKTLNIVLLALMFLPMLQGRLQIVPLKPLHGATEHPKKPIISLESYRSGDYAKQAEAYLSDHFGFREPVIRLYNQYLWSFYRKTYSQDVTAGKKDWLFFPASVRDYYGKEMMLWQNSVEEAQRNFDLDVQRMNWVRTILKENGVELLAFVAPEKSELYPEYLPDDEPDTTTFNAREYYELRFKETGFPCIEMTRWFQQMKDTVDYPLIPQAGAHWLFPSVYAADSLFRLMGDLKGITLPKLRIGTLHESDNHGADNDLEHLLNLMLPLSHRFGFSPTAAVSVELDSTMVKPRVLFVGNSYFWAFDNFIPLDEVFDNVEFWYYFSTAYFGENLKQTCPVTDFNLLEKLLDFDYVVWFSTGNQMNKGTMNFANTVLLELCASDSLQRASRNHLADSLSIEGTAAEVYKQTCALLIDHPELVPGLDGDSLPTLRNPELRYAKYTKEIRKDSLWMEALKVQAFLRTATLQHMLQAEADRLHEGKPLYRDQKNEIAFGLQCLQEVEELKLRMLQNEETMEAVRQKAVEHGKTLEKSLDDSAKWIIRRKYHLVRCRLLDDPDAEIPIPQSLESI